MKPLGNPFLNLIAGLSLASSLQAADQYWNPSPLSADWANSVWSATSGGGSLTTWTAANNAIFDQTGTYSVTINADQTAGNINIKAGTVTFDGTNTVSSNNLIIDSGASLTAASDRFLKVGTTTLTVNGTLTQTAAVSSSTRRVSIAGGNGSIVLSGGFRTNGDFNFAGDISGTGSILTDGGGTFTLSGNNTYAGDTLIRNGNTVRVGSTTALSVNSFLRFGGGNNIIELTGADFSRTLGSSAGQVRFHNGADGAGNSGFAAVNADRTVALNGTVSWGAGLFNPGVFYLGTAASTHKVTLTTGIDLNAATRTISTANGSAAIEAEVSGALSNGTLLATGTGTLKLSGNNSLTTIDKGAAGTDTGTLILSGSNTFSNATLTFGTASQNRGAIRLENDNALGGVTVIAGNSGTGTSQARIELANNVTISGIEYRAGGRSNSTTSGAAIVNISGNNTWAGNIRISNTGGSYGIRSDAGKLTISGSLRNGLTDSRAWELTGAGDFLISGTIINSGTGSLVLTKSGAGTLEITGNSNTYTGGTNVSGGVLQVGNGGAGGTLGTGTINNNASLVFNRSDSFSVNNAITGSGSLTKQGAGILSLGGANDYAGGTSVTAGGLTFLNTSAKPASGTTTVAAGTTLGLGVSSSAGFFGSSDVNALFSGSLANVTNAADSFVGIDTSAGDFEHAVAITSNTRGLHKLGANTLTLSTANAYTGVTQLSAGTVSVSVLGDGGVAGNLGAASAAASNIVFAGGALQFSAASAASSNRGFTINAGSTGTINVSSASGELTLSGSVPTTTGIFYKTGSGALILDPGASASLSLGALSANGGNLTLKSGTLNTTSIDSAVSAYFAGVGARGGTLTVDGATLNVGGGRSLKPGANGNGNLNIVSGAVNAPSIVIGHNGTVAATQSGGTVTTTSLYHQDAGVGSSYTLTGGTLIAQRIHNNTGGAHDFTLNLNGGTLKSASGTTNLIDNQNSGTQIAVLLGAGNTIIDTTDSNASIVRPMGDMPTVAGTFTKAGSNTLTLTAANTYTGATTITGGTLALTGSGSIASSSAIIVGANTTFDVSGVTGGFSLAVGQTLSGPGAVAGTMNVSGTLSPGSSPGTLTTGSQTWLDGGDYNWQVLDALGTAGSGYDTIAITGTLDLSSLTTGGYNINLWSLSSTGPDVSGNALNFVGTSNYSWILASASSGITGFNAADFVINSGAFNGTDGFTNPLAGGDFSIAQSGNNLVLNFTAVPEPGAAFLGGLGMLCLLRRRR